MTGRLGSALRVLRRLIGRDRERRRLERQAAGIRIDPSVTVRSSARLTLGREAVVDHGVLLHCGGMPWSPPDGGISLGARTYIGPNSVLFGAGRIDIGDAVLISPGVVITSHQHTFRDNALDIREQPISFGNIIIEDNVWIGANATILPGVSIGRGSVVGAGAVVTRDVPPAVVVMGAPARVVRDR